MTGTTPTMHPLDPLLADKMTHPWRRRAQSHLMVRKKPRLCRGGTYL